MVENLRGIKEKTMPAPIYYDPDQHFWQDDINEGIYPGNDDYVYNLPYGPGTHWGTSPLGPDGYSALGRQSNDIPEWYYPGYGLRPPDEEYMARLRNDPEAFGMDRRDMWTDQQKYWKSLSYRGGEPKRNFGDRVWRTQAEWDAMPQEYQDYYETNKLKNPSDERQNYKSWLHDDLTYDEYIAQNPDAAGPPAYEDWMGGGGSRSQEITQNRHDAWQRYYRDWGMKAPITPGPGMPPDSSEPPSGYDPLRHQIPTPRDDVGLLGGGGIAPSDTSPPDDYGIMPIGTPPPEPPTSPEYGIPPIGTPPPVTAPPGDYGYRTYQSPDNRLNTSDRAAYEMAAKRNENVNWRDLSGTARSRERTASKKREYEARKARRR